MACSNPQKGSINAIKRLAIITALTPSCVCEECASLASMVVLMAVIPLCALMTFIPVGSPTITACGRGIVFFSVFINDRAPKQPTSSS